MLATRLGVSARTTRSWCNGRREIPPNVAAWIEDLARRMSMAPKLPEDWLSQPE